MYIIGMDRCDYRTMDNARLIEEARYTPNPELAIVLAERLKESERETRLAERLASTESW